jgi:hypothetical protein
VIGKIGDYFWHIALPVLASTISAFATLTLLTKNSFLDEIKKHYVMTARAKGLTERRVLYGHVFRNAMLIVIAGFPAVFIGVFFGGLASSRRSSRSTGSGGWVRGGGRARLPGDLRHALRLRSDRAGGEYPVRPDVCAGRSAHRLRDAGGLRRWRCPTTARRQTRPRIPPHAPVVNQRLAVAAQPARWRNFKAQPPRLLVADHLLGPVRADAVRRVHRQRQADPRAVSRRLLHADLPLLPRDGVRRGFPDRGDLCRPEVQCLIVSGGLEDASTIPRGHRRCRRWRGRGRGDREGLDALAAHSLQLRHGRPAGAAPSPPNARTGWAPTTPSATCWRG